MKADSLALDMLEADSHQKITNKRRLEPDTVKTKTAFFGDISHTSLVPDKTKVSFFHPETDEENPLFLSEEEKQRINSFILKSIYRQNYQTPYLLMDSYEILNNLNYFNRYLPNVKIHYAVKANSCPKVVSLLKEHGCGFDIASAQEAHTVCSADYDPKAIILSHPIKNKAALHALYNYKIGAYTFDTEEELEKIAAYEATHETSHRPKAFLRIKLEPKGVQINLNEKFGCKASEAISLIKKAYELGLNPAGIAFHVGTQSVLSKNHSEGIKLCITLIKKLKIETGITLKKINIGGGFPDVFYARQQGICLDKYFQEIGDACTSAEKEGFELCCEPGRILISSAGYCVLGIMGMNAKSSKKSVYIDDGIYGCFSGKFFDYKRYSFHGIRISGDAEPFSKKSTPYAVFGPTCDSIDIINEHCLLPSNIKECDILWAPNMGAYSVVTSSEFNGFPAAKTLLGNSLFNAFDDTIVHLPEKELSMLKVAEPTSHIKSIAEMTPQYA
jgi:ornithine decarboxylase